MNKEIQCSIGHNFNRNEYPVCPICWKEYYVRNGNSELPKTSGPAENALYSEGLKTLEDLTYITEKEIKNLHGMGPKAIRILKEVLENRGLGFAKDSK